MQFLDLTCHQLPALVRKHSVLSFAKLSFFQLWWLRSWPPTFLRSSASFSDSPPPPSPSGMSAPETTLQPSSVDGQPTTKLPPQQRLPTSFLRDSASGNLIQRWKGNSLHPTEDGHGVELDPKEIDHYSLFISVLEERFFSINHLNLAIKSVRRDCLYH